jgi:hypothetical protein
MGGKGCGWLQMIVFGDPFIMHELVELERQGALDKIALPQGSEHHIVNELTSNPLWKVVRKVSNILIAPERTRGA